MKKLFILFLLLLTSSCKQNNSSLSSSIDYSINMNTNFIVNDTLIGGENKKTKVIVLLGQSNASGCTYNEYLEMNATKEDYIVLITRLYKCIPLQLHH